MSNPLKIKMSPGVADHKSMSISRIAPDLDPRAVSASIALWCFSVSLTKYGIFLIRKCRTCDTGNSNIRNTMENTSLWTKQSPEPNQ